MTSENGLLSAFRVLLRECLVGVPPTATGTWFIQGRESLMESLAELDEQLASRKVHTELQSIAAHVVHCLFVLRLANAMFGRPSPEGTWEGTWSKQEVTAEEWQMLKSEFEFEAQLLMKNTDSDADWSQAEFATGTLVALPHLAFHLGAIRQLIHLARSQTS